MKKTSNYHTLIIGSGCAGYNAADWLYDLGVRNIAILTEGINMGTSRNTGSDKQTYYKLTLAGNEPDSVVDMARTLFAGGGVHGDTALAEAAGSVRSFMKLVNLGVPFPTDEYGAFVGYKTDHDPRRRATSCGPLTSRLMTEALERTVADKGIPILDGRQVIKLLTTEGRVSGLVAMNKADFSYETYTCTCIILATGGPAGIYAETVYPDSQTGALGLALEAGADMNNLQEWQYGLASTDFKWNVSGTYQQALPRYISVDAAGREYEFLPDYCGGPMQALECVFLKGYQWPFDVRKQKGSGQVDLAVAQEIHEKGRKVYMDYRTNPTGLHGGFDGLSEEVRSYLVRSGAVQETPIERLAHMNPQAIALYHSHDIDLWRVPLRIALCAQHANGGVAVDVNWESTVKGLFAVGEAAGTFGVYRPGGSALNAGQVGAMRAAEHIARTYKNTYIDKKTAAYEPPFTLPERCFNTNVTDVTDVMDETNETNATNATDETDETNETDATNENDGNTGDGEDFLITTQQRMSHYAAYRRNIPAMDALFDTLCTARRQFFKMYGARSKEALPFMYKRYDILLTQIAVLSAMRFAATQIGSRGSALVERAAETATDAAADNPYDDRVVVTRGDASFFMPVRPLPEPDDWFENVWAAYRERSIPIHP